MRYPMKNEDIEAVEALVKKWTSSRQWAEQLLVDSLGLASVEDILNPEHKGNKQIPKTEWFYRTHGVGVDKNWPNLIDNDNSNPSYFN